MNTEKKSSVSYIDAKADFLAEVSHKIWEFAELSLKEHRSCEYYVSLLKKEGFSVEEKLYGIETSFAAKFGSGRPVIGILGEYDALSGLSQKAAFPEKEAAVQGAPGHGCGHNMLGAGAFGAALGIKNYLESTKKQGTVIFFGCPGEEGGASKALFARDGGWNGLDAALTWHPGDTNEITAGTCNSCIQVIYEFSGVSSHAAGDPENGRSALDAAELMNVGVQFLREHMKSDARIHYSILDAGGISPNVVQPEAKLLYMIRSPKVKDALALENRVDRIAEGAALMTETTVKKIFVDGCSGTFHNVVLSRLLYENMMEIGAPQYSEDEMKFAGKIRQTYPNTDAIPGIGSLHSREYAASVKEMLNGADRVMNDFVLPFYSGEHFNAGSTDVGDVSWNTPTAQFNAVAWPAECPGHSWQNVSCGGSSIGDKAVVFAAKVLCAAAIDLLEKPEIVEAARKEFNEGPATEGYYCPVPEGASLYIV